MSLGRAPPVPWWQYAAAAAAGLGSLALIGYLTRDESGETFADQERKKRAASRAAASGGSRVGPASTKQTTEERLRTILGLAEQARAAQQFAKAEAQYLQALELIATEFGPDHVLNALAHQALCNVFVSQKKWAAGEQSLRLAKQIMAKNNVPVSQYAEIDSLLAEILVQLNKLDEAEQLVSSSLRAFESWPADEETDVAVSQALLTLGQIKARMGQFEAAAVACKKANSRVLRSASPADPMSLQCQMQLADVMLLMGDLAGAKAVFDELVEKQGKLVGLESVKMGLLQNMIFTKLFEREFFADAEPYLRAAIAVFAQNRGTREHRQVGLSVNLDLVALLYELGRPDEADALLAEHRKEADGEKFTLALALSRTLRTTEAVVATNFDAVYYMLKLEIKQNIYAAGGAKLRLPEGAFVEAIFDNPVEPASPYSVGMVVDAAACRNRSLLIRSPPLLKFSAEHEDAALLVRVRVYADESKADKPIAQHFQLARYSASSADAF